MPGADQYTKRPLGLVPRELMVGVAGRPPVSVTFSAGESCVAQTPISAVVLRA